MLVIAIRLIAWARSSFSFDPVEAGFQDSINFWRGMFFGSPRRADSVDDLSTFGFAERADFENHLCGIAIDVLLDDLG